MRKLLLVLVLAGLLVLALSVPALAGPSNPPNFFGQMHKIGNWSGGVPPGQREFDPFSGLTGNPGQVISTVVHLIQMDPPVLLDPDDGTPYKNFGYWINGAKESTWN